MNYYEETKRRIFDSLCESYIEKGLSSNTLRKGLKLIVSNNRWRQILKKGFYKKRVLLRCIFFRKKSFFHVISQKRIDILMAQEKQ